MFCVYAILVHLAFLLLLPMLLLHPKLREGFWARLGRLPPGWPGLPRRPVVWAHGASAGDLLALEPILQELAGLRPDAAVLLTTVTDSGMAVARRGLVRADAVGYLPYDLPWAAGRVMRAVRPDVLVLEYAEVWPALLRAARRVGARVVLTNGRFHERALGRYRLLYRLIGNPLRHLDALCMRSEEEVAHAVAIGADPARVRALGNSKFDRCAADARSAEVPPALGAALGHTPESLWLVAGSTHEGEEAGLLDLFARLRASRPALRLLVAPRYLGRVGRVLALARERDLPAARRTLGAGAEPVVVLDTLGELAQVYALAAVVFVGGSLVERGGQNILEPAARGRPVLFGPHMENFQDSVQVLLGRGGLQVPDLEQLELTLARLLDDPQARDRLGALAAESVRAVQGGSRRMAEVIAGFLPAATGASAGGAR
ncbi:MAG TPA: glycosyltransferase N-terminal domain-containing protein [Myxococcota bacterium]|nr:glycosyltransferase N-terminal domain-containing protein [Myxococcota bacterium]HRY93854.1 glycosyltransferase N-terminal domain-containing protein [Myxococcota bacterium]HSA24005.1 glycosyltransferase N-terminal domain-containing protein [Myxococcota bacterium]